MILRSVSDRIPPLKAQFRASLADCFGLTLAQKLGADFRAKDRHELDAVQKSGVVQIVLPGEVR
jgi:hypothetical protein